MFIKWCSISLIMIHYSLGNGIYRRDGEKIAAFQKGDISLDSLVFISGYVHSGTRQLIRSEYHFQLDFLHSSVKLFCDDRKYGSDEYRDAFQRLAARLQTNIPLETGIGKLKGLTSKEEIASLLEGIFDEFNTPEEWRHVVIDYRQNPETT